MKKIEPNTDLNTVKPVGMYKPVGVTIVDSDRKLITYSEQDVKEFIRTLKKLYNDFTIRPDEGKALDFAINFIEWKVKQDGLDKMIKDCERHLTCKGCPHEKECE